MSLLIFSGLLYLCGISTVLILKPEIMFSADGNWKEFGLGRGREKYTWMPFWLFSITWAIVSYMIVLVIASATGFIGTNVPTESVKSVKSNDSVESVESVDSVDSNDSVESIKNISKKSKKPGYYILNTEKGSPKYIYLGPVAPNLVYNSV